MIKDIGNYIVHSDGTVISKKLKRPLKSWDMKGYRQIKCDGKAITVHRLLAELFIPNPKNKMEVNHKNGNKSDNRVENLEWATHAENIQHAYNKGMIQQRGLHWKKLKDSDYSIIKDMRNKGTPYAIICDRFGLSRSYAWVIVNRK